MEVLPVPVTIEGSDVLRRAVAGYLTRYKGLSRSHTESDLRVFLRWCTERGLEPLAAQRPHIELHVRWMQEVRRFKRSTVSLHRVPPDVDRRRLLPHIGRKVR
jgi:integrase/recombinase XerD